MFSQLYLLGSFYDVSPASVISSLVIDSLTTYIPFRLLRPLSLAHSASTSKYSVNVRNKDIITSNSIQAYTTLLGGAIYAVTLFTSYSTFLPVYLVTYFEGIPSIAAAHASSPIAIVSSQEPKALEWFTISWRYLTLFRKPSHVVYVNSSCSSFRPLFSLVLQQSHSSSRRL